MKLLKLNNGQSLTSLWSNNFNELNIKPFSKIALKNVSINTDESYTIGPDNDTFQIQTVENEDIDQLDTPIDVEIAHKTYRNIDYLLGAVF